MKHWRKGLWLLRGARRSLPPPGAGTGPHSDPPANRHRRSDGPGAGSGADVRAPAGGLEHHQPAVRADARAEDAHAPLHAPLFRPGPGQQHPRSLLLRLRCRDDIGLCVRAAQGPRGGLPAGTSPSKTTRARSSTRSSRATARSAPPCVSAATGQRDRLSRAASASSPRRIACARYRQTRVRITVVPTFVDEEPWRPALRAPDPRQCLQRPRRRQRRSDRVDQRPGRGRAALHGQSPGTGWIVAIEKTLPAPPVRVHGRQPAQATTVDQYIAAAAFFGAAASNVYLGFNIIRQWKL